MQRCWWRLGVLWLVLHGVEGYTRPELSLVSSSGTRGPPTVDPKARLGGVVTPRGSCDDGVLGRWTGDSRRRVGATVLSALCPLLLGGSPCFGAAVDKDMLAASGAVGRVYGIDEDAPFRAALTQIKGLLDTLGVEGAVPKERASIPDGPIIARPYVIGLNEGTDRLRNCPSNAPCLSSTRAEASAAAVAPFVFFDQKGDAVGNLLELLYSAEDATVLTAKGNFFNGAGVYVLAELTDTTSRGATVHDVEFQFLPGVLENVVDVRILGREGRGRKLALQCHFNSMCSDQVYRKPHSPYETWTRDEHLGPNRTSSGNLSGNLSRREGASKGETFAPFCCPGEGADFTSKGRQQELLGVFGKAVGWVPLTPKTNTNAFTNEEKGIYDTSALEMRYREQFEADMEAADRQLRAQMDKEKQRIEQLKKEVSRLLDDLSRQEDARYNEYRELRSRSAAARAEYEEGVNKRIGGVANDGRYAASQSIRLGNSFAGLINSRDDVTAQIYDNVQQDDDAPQPKPPKKKLFGSDKRK